MKLGIYYNGVVSGKVKKEFEGEKITIENDHPFLIIYVDDVKYRLAKDSIKLIYFGGWK